MRWLLAAVLALVAQAAAAQSPVAEYWASSGSLPPEFAWDVSVTFRDDGSVALRRCKGYATEGPGCTLRRARVSAEVLDTIRQAADDAGLPARPPQRAPDDEVPVGGGAVGGAVWWQGEKIDLPAYPSRADAARVAAVLAAIRAAIPPRLAQRFVDGN
jgi:hypothetical protein